MNENSTYVKLADVIGELAYRNNTYIISFDNLIKLGKMTAKVYKLEDTYKYITFDIMCEYIQAYVNTPFGAKNLKDLSENNY